MILLATATAAARCSTALWWLFAPSSLSAARHIFHRAHFELARGQFDRRPRRWLHTFGFWATGVAPRLAPAIEQSE